MTRSSPDKPSLDYFAGTIPTSAPWHKGILLPIIHGAGSLLFAALHHYYFAICPAVSDMYIRGPFEEKILRTVAIMLLWAFVGLLILLFKNKNALQRVIIGISISINILSILRLI
jgi:hypothetical protein